MPELPEVETVMKGLEKTIKGQIISNVLINRPNLRWPLPNRMKVRFCLLYTSPSPRDRTRSRMPSSA